jgi:hypothetical protein
MPVVWKVLGERVIAFLLGALLLVAIGANGALVLTLTRQVVIGIPAPEAARPVAILGVELAAELVPEGGELTYLVEYIHTRSDCVGAGVTRWLISASGWQHRLEGDTGTLFNDPGHNLAWVSLRLPRLPAHGGRSWRLMSTVSYECDEGMRHVRFSTPYFEVLGAPRGDDGAASR